MPPTALIHDDTREARDTREAQSGAAVRATGGRLVLVVGLAGFAVWFGWRITHPVWHPVALVFLFAELLGVVAAVAVAYGLANADAPRTVFEREPRDSHWFAHSVADLVGRTRAADLHRDVRTAVRAAPRWRCRGAADMAIAGVLLDGPRRLVMLVAVAIGLFLGVSPFGPPPWWALVGLAVGTAGISAAHVALGGGRLRPGDRLRWSYGAIGEIVSRSDVPGVAPRRWVGSVAAAVTLSVAIALRGMSDRWTHGLPAMADGERATVMLIAIVLVIGALFTIHTSPRPTQADAHLVPRHLEERTARQTLLAAVVLVGAVGLLAGIMPNGRAPSTPAAPAVTHEVARG